MSSFYSDASIVLIPSGYKNQKIYCAKPTDGSADLTFSRASSATRVASNGLIEKVRTNLVLQSNTFSNASWTKTGGTTLTAGQADYLGGTNAWKWEATGTGTIQLSQSPAGATIRTSSIYAKAGSVSTLNLWIGSAVTFNLSTGTVTSGTGVITSVGNGWYRCSAFGTGISHNPYFTSASAGDYVLISFAQLEEGDIATDYIPTTTAAVSVGPVANVPRLDYLGSSCPRLLLEGQRSNLITFSEQLDNAAWTKTNCTISANAVNSPDGSQNADNVVTAAANSDIGRLTATVAADTTTYTQSGFFKWVSGYELVKFRIALSGGTSQGAAFVFNARTGAFVSSDTTYKIESYGNGWYRVSHQITNNGTNTSLITQIYPTNETTQTQTLSAWGFGMEAGAYATSYIPTLSASATRGADAASKTGISSLIGQTEGTLFVEAANLFLSGSRTIALLYTSGSAFYQIYLNSSNQVRVDVNGSFLFLGGSIAANTTYKIAFAYKSGDYALYINGTQIATSASTTVPSSLTDYYLGNSLGSEQSGAYSQALLFKTRLTNAQLAELTTL